MQAKVFPARDAQWEEWEFEKVRARRGGIGASDRPREGEKAASKLSVQGEEGGNRKLLFLTSPL